MIEMMVANKYAGPNVYAAVEGDTTSSLSSYIIKLDGNGTEIWRSTFSGSGAENFSRNDSSDLYVYADNDIIVMDIDGNEVNRKGSTNGRDVQIGLSGNIYHLHYDYRINPPHNTQIHKYDQSLGLTWITSFSDSSPRDIAIDSYENSYATIYSGGVRKVSPTGQVEWGYSRSTSAGIAAHKTDGSCFVGSTDGDLFRLNSSGGLEWQTTVSSDPIYAVITDQNFCYAITNTGNLYRYTHAGVFVDSLNNVSSGSQHRALEVDSAGNIYIAGNNSIIKVSESLDILWEYFPDGGNMQVDSLAVDNGRWAAGFWD